MKTSVLKLQLWLYDVELKIYQRNVHFSYFFPNLVSLPPPVMLIIYAEDVS